MDDGLVSPLMQIHRPKPISSKVEIPKVGKLTNEELLTFSSFLWGPPLPPESYKLNTSECKFCLKVDEHYSRYCPYVDSVPKNAKVGSNCDVICKVCGDFFIKESCCGKDEGRAIRKIDRRAKHIQSSGLRAIITSKLQHSIYAS